MASHPNREEKSGDSGDTATTGSKMDCALSSFNNTSSGDTVADDVPDTPSSTKLLPLMQPPDEEEAQTFYYGLPSWPRLVGRASSGISVWENRASQHARWAADRNRSAWFQLNRSALGVIGDHAIRRCWYKEVQPRIITAIDRLPWTSIDVFRIGKEDTPLLERPVVVWVGLQNDGVPWEEVALALRACRRVLDAVQLTDVDCQFRVHKVAPLAGPRLLRPEPPYLSDLHVYSQPFTTAIGQNFYPLSSPDIKGTLGVYLRAQSDQNDKKGPVYALTCRHVGLPDSSNPGNAQYSRLVDDGNLTALPMGIAGQSITTDALYVLGRRRKIMTDAVREHGESFRQRLEEASTLYDTIKAFEPEEARDVGRVCLSPPIGNGSDSISWTRDWCLVRMDQSKFPDGECPPNIIYLHSRHMTVYELLLLGSPRKRELEFQIPEDSLLRINGVTPLSEIQSPPKPTVDADGDEYVWVGKRGAGTGLTWGCPSELMSTVRQCIPDGSTLISQEWAIHGWLGKRTVPFSAPGDSGAAVFDRDGRLGGFITKGTTDPTDKDLKADITYATPAELVLADVGKELGTPVVLT